MVQNLYCGRIREQFSSAYHYQLAMEHAIPAPAFVRVNPRTRRTRAIRQLHPTLPAGSKRVSRPVERAFMLRSDFTDFVNSLSGLNVAAIKNKFVGLTDNQLHGFAQNIAPDAEEQIDPIDADDFVIAQRGDMEEDYKIPWDLRITLITPWVSMPYASN